MPHDILYLVFSKRDYNNTLTFITLLSLLLFLFLFYFYLGKTQIINDEHWVWALTDLNSGQLTELKTVDQYKYLGVNQKLTLQKTINKKSSDMEMKALAYANAILKVTKTVPDKCDVLVRMWENVAIPSILYGSESLPIPLATIEKLQSVQINVGKWILGVPRSTANTFALLELGFKPMLTRIAVAKLNFYLKIKAYACHLSIFETVWITPTFVKVGYDWMLCLFGICVRHTRYVLFQKLLIWTHSVISLP